MKSVDLLMSAKGRLEGRISEVVRKAIVEWRKENDAEVTYIDIDVIPIGGIGQYGQYTIGLTNVNLLTKDGAEISRTGISYPVPPRKMDGSY